jgi:predicted enzyme related to lactoylglutathione lyase
MHQVAQLSIAATRRETDVRVENVDSAFKLFLSAGGEAVEAPFDIAIGRCARVRDPFGNVLVILDQSKGRLVTDGDGRVTGVRRSPD